jgi:putative flippase GtrA
VTGFLLEKKSNVLNMNTLSQFLKFIFVGGTGSLLLLVETFVLTEYLGVWYFWAFVISAICNWTYLYFAHTFFTFKKTEALKGTRYTLFLGIYFFAFLVNAALVYTMTSLGGVPYILSIIIGTAITTGITFSLSRRYVYTHEEHRDIEAAKQLIKKHWLAGVLALFIACSIVAPQLILRLDPHYQGVQLMGQDAEEHYSARTAEVYDGHPELGNVFLPGKDKPYVEPPVGEMVVAGVGKLFSLSSAPDAIVFSKFFFPLLIALCVYALIYSVSRSRMAALIGMVFVMIGGEYISGVSQLLSLLHEHIGSGSFTIFSRPVNPEVSSLMMFIALLIFYRGWFVRNVPRWWEVVSVGVLTGLSLYISPYVFSFLSGVFAISCIWFWIHGHHSTARRVIYAGVSALAALVPFIYNYILLHKSPYYAATEMRIGLVSNHHFIFSIWLALLLAASIFLWPRAYKSSRAFFIIMISVLWIVTDQHVLTGLYLQPSHFHWYITKPLVAIVGALYIAAGIRYFIKNQHARYAVAALSTLPLLYLSPLLHVSYYKAHPDQTAIASQAYAPVLEQLRLLPAEQTVWASPDMSLYIPIYTSDNAPNNSYAVYYLNPENIFEDSMFLNYRLEGNSPDTILNTFIKNRVQVSEYLYGLYYRDSTGSSASIPDSELARLAQNYRTFFARSYADIFKELSITVVVAPVEKRKIYDSIPALHLLKSLDNYAIYTVAN